MADSETTPDSSPALPDNEQGSRSEPITPARIETSDQTPGEVVRPTPGVVVTQPRRKRSKLWWLLLIILLAAAAGAAYHYTRPTKSSSTTAVNKDIPVLKVGVVDALTDTYPLGSNATTTMAEVNSQLFEGLVRYQQLTKIAPQLATSWTNPDNTTWVFNLQHGVYFHSGRLLTAQDVKYSLDYAVAHDNDSNASASLSEANTIKEVDVVNNNQVKVVTTAPDPTLLNRLTTLFIFDSKAKLGDPNAGTGPYTVKPNTTPSATSIDLTAASRYWGGHIYTKEVDINSDTNIDNLSQATAKGQFDLAGDFSTAQLAKIPGARDISVDDFGVTFLGLNTLKTTSPLSTLAGRQAATYALDIPTILKAASLSGKATGQLIPATILGHDPSIKNPAYDPAKAKALLATVKNAAAPLTLSFPAGDESQVNEIAKELNAVGFNVKVSSQPDVGSLVDVAFAGKTDIFYLTYTSNILDGLDIIQNVVTAAASDYNSTQVNNLADQASATFDSTARIKLLQQIGQQVAKDIPDVPLYTLTRHYALTKPYQLQVDIPSANVGAYFWQTHR